MFESLLGIDIGCGGIKACIIDTSGKVLGYEFKEHEIVASKDGWSESDPNIYWKNTCYLINKLLSGPSVSLQKIRGLCVSSSVPALIMIDKEGNPINLAYNFLDNRASDEIEWLKENIGSERIFNLTAFNPNEQPVITSILWEKNNRKQDYKRINKVVTPDGFLNLKLTENITLNYSCATFFGIAFDIVKKEFDQSILKEIGIDNNIIPDLYPCEDLIGEVTSKASKETGLPLGIPVIAGTVDAYAGWIGGGAIEEGDLQINLGTAAVIGSPKRDSNFLPHLWNGVYPINSKENYVIFGSTTTGGHLLRYMRDNFSKFELYIENISGIDSYELLTLEAQKIDIGSNGLIVLPYLMGARTPEYNRDARGVIFGMSLSHSRGHLIRAMMEGVAYSVYDNFKTIEKNLSKINYPIVLNEGGAKNRLWRRIFTDVLNKPTVLLENRTGAPYGDAIIAGVSIGILQGYEVAKEWANYIDYMEPIKENHRVYLEYFELFKKIYLDLNSDFKMLSNIREKKTG